METITDSELLKIAETWAKDMPINLGIKTAFAAGYRMAESKAKNCIIPDVSDTVCNCSPTVAIMDKNGNCKNCGKTLFHP